MNPIKNDIEETTKTIRQLRVKRLTEAQRYGPLVQRKLDALDFAFNRFGVVAFADLGAAYRVDGGYSFYALDTSPATRAIIVDTHPTERLFTDAAVREGVEIVRGNFGDPAVIEKVGEVDAVVVFDVLLHQVAPDWDEVRGLYAPKTRVFVIHNPQWLGPETVRLLDLGKEKFLALVPKIRNEAVYRAAIDRPDEVLPERGRRNRDVHHIWQWGITTTDLVLRMLSLGFALRYFQDHGYFGGSENFRNQSFVFEKGA